MVLTGTAGTALALAPSDAQPEVVGFLRLAIGGPILLAAAMLGGKLGRMPIRPVLASAISMGVYQPFFFNAVDRTGVAVATIVALGSAPMFTGALVFATRRAALNRDWAIATVIAISGGALIVGGGESIGVDTTGVILALGAGLSYSVFAVAARGLLDNHPPLAVMGVTLTGGAVVLLPVVVGANLTWVGSAHGAATALYIGVAATAIAYILFGYGMARTPVTNVVTLTLAEPLTGAMLGVFVLGEVLTPLAALGAALLLLGLVLAGRNSRMVQVDRVVRSAGRSPCAAFDPKRTGSLRLHIAQGAPQPGDC